LTTSILIDFRNCRQHFATTVEDSALAALMLVAHESTWYNGICMGISVLHMRHGGSRVRIGVFWTSPISYCRCLGRIRLGRRLLATGSKSSHVFSIRVINNPDHIRAIPLRLSKSLLIQVNGSSSSVFVLVSGGGGGSNILLCKWTFHRQNRQVVACHNETITTFLRGVNELGNVPA
jgi:hypothetical protein